MPEGRPIDTSALSAFVVSNPRPGARVRIRYRAGVRDRMPWHDAVGTVEIVGRRRPRNHGVRIGAVLVVVPAGNLNLEK